jgi:Rieske Fe-S protein
MQINRREFVAAGALTVCGFCVVVGGCASGGGGTAGATGPHDADRAEADQRGTLDIGPAQDFPRDGAYDQFAEADHVLVVRQGGEIYAVSSICTHRACDLEPVGDSLRCPCHGSRFDLAGRVVKGPAGRPLPRYAITTGAGGHLVVDRGTKLQPGDANAAVRVA